VRAVAIGPVFGFLAGAKRGLFFFGDFERQWAERRTGVATVAERLVLRFSASAPEVFAWFQSCRDWAFTCADGFFHASAPLGIAAFVEAKREA
jgi:hypothetical protein